MPRSSNFALSTLPFAAMPYARITSKVSKSSVDTVAASTAVAKTLNEQWGVPAAFMMVQLELEAPMLLQLNDEVRTVHRPTHELV